MLEFFVTNAPSPHYWNLDSCLAVFLSIGSIWDSFATTRNSMQNGLKWCNQCKSSFHKVALEIYATNGPDPPHWTLNSCFGAFCTIWVHLGLFGCLTRLDAKWAKLEQSSCHEVASRFFAKNAPDPSYWTLNSCFGAFCTIRVYLGQLFALRNSVQNGPN